MPLAPLYELTKFKFQPNEKSNSEFSLEAQGILIGVSPYKNQKVCKLNIANIQWHRGLPFRWEEKRDQNPNKIQTSHHNL